VGAKQQVTAVSPVCAGIAAVVVIPVRVPGGTASTVISDRPDSGNHDNPVHGANHTWADDSFTRTASATFDAQVASSFCPGTTRGECLLLDRRDGGQQRHVHHNPTAASGAYSPGNGTDGTGAAGPFPIGATARGVMSGRYHFGFYATADTARASGVPSAEDDHGTLPLSPASSTCTGGSSCGVTNCQWIEQFFPKGTQFWDLNGNLDPSCLGLYWSFYYYVPTGGDEGCSEVTSRWVTASWDNLGTDPVDGNTFAPGPSDC
jgi:hypothetical protein